MQLPAGASLSRAPLAADAIKTLVRSRLGLVVSVGAASNKFLAKRASATCKPDGVAIVASDEDVAAVLAKTPARKVPGCGGVGVAANTDGVGRENRVRRGEEITSRARRRVGTRARRRGTRGARREGRVRRAGGVRGAANGTVGVHTSLTAAPRRMPTRPGSNRSLPRRRTRGNVRTGTRLGTRSCRRVGGRHGARFSGEGVRRRRGGEEMAEDAHRVRRDENRASRATTTKSKSRAFPAKTPNARGWSELDVANACAEACRALVRATIVGVDAGVGERKCRSPPPGSNPSGAAMTPLRARFAEWAGTRTGKRAGKRAGKGRGCGRRPTRRRAWTTRVFSAVPRRSGRERMRRRRRRSRGRGRDGGTFRAGRR